MPGIGDVDGHHGDECGPDTPAATVPEAGAGRWRVCQFTVVGPAHLVDGRPSQDALTVRPRHPSRDPAVVSAAAADGHGHPAHGRSAIGARLAVAKLADVLARVSGQARGQNRGAVEGLLTRELPEEFTRAWREAVASDMREDPLAADDYRTLATQLSDNELTRATLVPIHQYGTTALGVAVTSEWMLVGGIGDGDVVVIDTDLSASCPLPADISSSANVTASLCQADPLSSWRAAALSRTSDGRPPVLVLVATDGVTGGMSRESLCRELERLAHVLVNEDHTAFERALWQFIGDAQRVLGDDATAIVLYEPRAIERLRTAAGAGHAEAAPRREQDAPTCEPDAPKRGRWPRASQKRRCDQKQQRCLPVPVDPLQGPRTAESPPDA